jgi:hypothetical protein
MEIINARKKHIPEIVDLWEEFALFHEPFDPRYPMKDDVRIGYEKHLKELMAEENTKVLVAVEKEKLVGYSIAQIRQSSPAFLR